MPTHVHSTSAQMKHSVMKREEQRPAGDSQTRLDLLWVLDDSPTTYAGSHSYASKQVVGPALNVGIFSDRSTEERTAACRSTRRPLLLHARHVTEADGNCAAECKTVRKIMPVTRGIHPHNQARRRTGLSRPMAARHGDSFDTRSSAHARCLPCQRGCGGGAPAGSPISG